MRFVTMGTFREEWLPAGEGGVRQKEMLSMKRRHADKPSGCLGAHGNSPSNIRFELLISNQDTASANDVTKTSGGWGRQGVEGLVLPEMAPSQRARGWLQTRWRWRRRRAPGNIRVAQRVARSKTPTQAHHSFHHSRGCFGEFPLGSCWR